MNFDIIYKNISIESFQALSIPQAKKYVKARYINNGAGCSLIYFDAKNTMVTIQVNK